MGVGVRVCDGVADGVKDNGDGGGGVWESFERGL